MLVAFGDTPKPQPPVLPQSHQVELFGATVGLDRLLMAGIVIAAAIVLAALYRWTRFGLATRAASEDEVSATLAGLSPNSLSMVNTILGCLVAGGLGVLAASITVLYWQTLPLYIVPALAAALFARFTSFGIACTVGLVFGMAQSVLLYYMAPKPWFPTDHTPSGSFALPGVWDLFVFVMIVIAMFWRGASLPGRGELIEKRMPFVPRSEHLLRNALIGAAACAAALILLPWDFRQALIVSLLASLICLSYVIITGFVGQISVVQVALAGVAGYTVSKMATNYGIGFPLAPLIAVAVATVVGLLVAVSALRVRGVSLAVVTLAAAVAIEKFGFANYRWGGGSGSAPVDEPKLGGLDLGPECIVARPRRQAAEPRLRLLPARPDRRPLPVDRQRAAIEPRSADAGGALERARSSRGRRQRDRGQADSIRALGHDRGHRGRDVRLRVRRRRRDEVRRVCRARPDRLRVRRRDHDDLRRLHRGPDLDVGPRLVLPRQVVRPLRQLGVAVRRRRAYRHADHEPRGCRRRQLQEGCSSGATTTNGTGGGAGTRGRTS